MAADLSFEAKVWRRGYAYIGGIDEVGRGCFAGPIVAGCVVFSKELDIKNIPVRIDDSKKLAALQRGKAGKWIKANALSWGVGEASVRDINRLGIVKASQIAFRRAIKACRNVDYLLIDAFYIPYVKGLRRKNQLAIVNGDEKSISIAAASIIAKVYRDNLMEKLSVNRGYTYYLWWKNKGYGTKEHRTAIVKYGLTRYHRKAFVKKYL